MLRSPRILPLAFLIALVGTLSACGPLDVDRAGAALSQPYVRLRSAQAVTQDQPGAGYTHTTLSARGVIEVANVAYEKEVVVRYQSDSGWLDSSASYLGPADDGNELWSFTTGVATTYLPYFGDADLPFAIRYRVAGTTAWDNNGGQNYHVWGMGASGTPEPSVALGADQVAVSDFTLGTDGLSGDVTVRNLGYQKQITIVYTTDEWKTVQTSAAGYHLSYGDGLESWSFSANGTAGASTVRFAVSYAVGGATYWDNHFGANYTATSGAAP